MAESRRRTAGVCLEEVLSIAETTSGFVTTSDGVRIHYIEAGHGRPIVLIPGWGFAGWIWEKQIDALSANYRVVAVDPRSQGESDKVQFGHLPQDRARDYKSLVDQLHLEQPILVGWSMGVGELLSYVDQFGDDGLGGLIFVDGLAPPDQNPDLAARLASWMPPFQTDREEQTDIIVRRMFKSAQSEQYLHKVMRSTMVVPTDTMVTLLYNMLAYADVAQAIARITRPVLLVHTPMTEPNADYLKQQLGDKAQLAPFLDEGHALFVDNPTKFNKAVDDFARGLPR